MHADLGRVGGRGGGQQRLLESDRNWQESAESIPNACSPQGERRMTESALNSFSKRTDVAMKSVYVKSLSFGSFLWSAGLGTVGI